jgi:hypothetical protein
MPKLTVPLILKTLGWSLTLPDGWVELDVDRATSRSSTRSLVDQASARMPEIAQNRDRWESVLSEAVSQLQDALIDRCAVWVENVSEQITLEASVVVSARCIQEGNDIRQIVSTFELSNEVEVVSLGGLDAVCVVSAESKKVVLSNGSTVVFNHHLRQFFVPVPGSTDTMVVLTFATPTTDFVGDLAGLFDDIASTLQVNP